MDHPGRPKIGRSWSFVAFATTALVLSAFGREASARCHAPERPVLSRSVPVDLLSAAVSTTTVDLDAAPAPASFGHLPCDGESASRPDREASPPTAVRPAPPTLDPPTSVPAPIFEPPTPPRHSTLPVDRPPRAT